MADLDDDTAVAVRCRRVKRQSGGEFSWHRISNRYSSAFLFCTCVLALPEPAATLTLFSVRRCFDAAQPDGGPPVCKLAFGSGALAAPGMDLWRKKPSDLRTPRRGHSVPRRKSALLRVPR